MGAENTAEYIVESAALDYEKITEDKLEEALTRARPASRLLLGVVDRLRANNDRTRELDEQSAENRKSLRLLRTDLSEQVARLNLLTVRAGEGLSPQERQETEREVAECSALRRSLAIDLEAVERRESGLQHARTEAHLEVDELQRESAALSDVHTRAVYGWDEFAPAS